MKLYRHEQDFLITDLDVSLPHWQEMTELTWLFGYGFLKNQHFRNEAIMQDCFDWVKEHNIDASGVFCALNFKEGKIDICFDPLCQFNVFYYRSKNNLTISSSLDMIQELHELTEVDEEFLFDWLAYYSVMRKKTILKNVNYICFDDLYDDSGDSLAFIKDHVSITINIPNYKKYDKLNYQELLQLYIKRLKHKAKIVADKFDEVNIQLTGGADSRLAFSAFLGYDNIRAYVYGDGSSQNRLIFEELIKRFNVRRAENIKVIGAPLNNSARLFKMLSDVNYLKLTNINTAMNGSPGDDRNICMIMGIYGANVSNGVGIPLKPSENKRVAKMPSDLFTYYDYVISYRNKFSDLRGPVLIDRFYINNRAKSHCAAHSICNNKYVSSIDILYDFINLKLVERCPWSDDEINKSAITIDLIYLTSPQLAMFPYDDRKIPMYRHFENIPVINCFEGYSFPSRELQSFIIQYPKVHDSYTNYFNTNGKYESVSDMFKHDLIKKELEKPEYANLKYLANSNEVLSSIFLNFLLGKLKMKNLVGYGV